jgi:RNA polymerase sigma factor (sigma-70 family)
MRLFINFLKLIILIPQIINFKFNQRVVFLKSSFNMCYDPMSDPLDISKVLENHLYNVYSNMHQDLLNHKLLSKAEEISFAKRFQLMNHVLNTRSMLSSNSSSMISLTNLSNILNISANMISSIIEKGLEAQKSLMKMNYKLVVHTAKAFRGRGVSFTDLVLDGNRGLMKAVEKYDPGKGCRFATYASWWINQAICEGLAERGQKLKLSLTSYKLLVKIKRVLRDDPTMSPSQIASILNLPELKVRWLLYSATPDLRLDGPAFEGLGKDRDSRHTSMTDVVSQDHQYDDGMSLASMLGDVYSDSSSSLFARLCSEVLLPQERSVLLAHMRQARDCSSASLSANSREVSKQLGLGNTVVKHDLKSAIEKLRTALCSRVNSQEDT